MSANTSANDLSEQEQESQLFSITKSMLNAYFQPIRARIEKWPFDDLGWTKGEPKRILLPIPLDGFNQNGTFIERAASFLALDCHVVLVNAAIKSYYLTNNADQIKTHALTQVHSILKHSGLLSYQHQDIFVSQFKMSLTRLLDALRNYPFTREAGCSDGGGI